MAVAVEVITVSLLPVSSDLLLLQQKMGVMEVLKEMQEIKMKKMRAINQSLAPHH